MYKKFLIFFCVCLFGAEFDNALIQKSLDANLNFLPLDDDLNDLVGLNSANKSQIELGKKLFFDPRISSDKKISCNSCHNLALNGVDLQATQARGLNTLSVYNSALNATFSWEGKTADLKEFIASHFQDSEIISGSDEEIKKIKQYEIDFKKAYGESKTIDKDAICDAITLFIRSLNTPNRFDDFLRGNVRALSKNEQRGLNLFIDKNCVSCHFGINLGGANKNISEMSDYRFASALTLRFKDIVRIPSLRNIVDSAPYMHNGIYINIADAIRDMTRQSYANREVFSDDEMEYLIMFLNTLNGAKADLNYPMLPF